MARARRRASKVVKLTKPVAELIRWERACRVATVSEAGRPHVVPVCHVLADGKVYFGSGNDATKVAHLRKNPSIAVSVDVYTDDWAALRGVMVQGTARLIASGPSFRRARRLLYEKYRQYPDQAALDESDSVIVEVTPTHVFTWGF